MLEAWGWFSAQEKEVAETDFTPGELAIFQRGMKACIAGEAPRCDLNTIAPDLEKFSLRRREKYWKSLEESNLAAGRLYISKLASKKLVEISDGLKYEVLRSGVGPFPQPEQTVNVHYVGRLTDGTDFTELGPYDLVLVKSRLLPAIYEGIQKINKGGMIRLYVPPAVSGIDENRPGVPRGATTVYEIELLDITKTAPDDLANSLLPPAPDLPVSPLSGASAEQIIEAWGWTTARKTGLAELGLAEAELSAFLNGLTSAIKGEPLRQDAQKIRPWVDKFVRENREKVRAALRQKRLAAMNLFFAELKKNPHVVELPDGLRYEILAAGGVEKPKTGQIVRVDYTGRLLDGTIFDKTYNEPIYIEVGAVIPGWNEGIQLIGKGGRIKLYIPPSIGYGDENMSGVVSRIPASSLLIYEIELLDIQDPKKEP